MGLTLKIGAGVFVGGLALFLVINAPAWIHQSLRDSWNEQALEIMNRLTPDIVIQRCGKPNRDFLQAGQRWLVYDGRLVALDFVSEKDSWTFGLMYEGVWTVTAFPMATGSLAKVRETRPSNR